MTIDEPKALVATGDRMAEGWNSSLVMGALDKETLALVEAVNMPTGSGRTLAGLMEWMEGVAAARGAFNANLESLRKGEVQLFPGIMSDDDIKRYYEDVQRRNGKLALEIMKSYVDGQHSWVVVLVTDDVLGTAIELSAKEIVKVSHHEILVDGVPWVLPEIEGMSFADVFISMDD